MEFLRTPDERFEGLEGYDFKPNYCQVDDGQGGELRLHYLDESLDESLDEKLDESGTTNAETILCMHGQPTWSYLYRFMIPIFVKAGYRVIVPDLIGFGRSDKPTKREDYSYQNHVNWINDFVRKLDLKDITLVCQDWGGLIGLRVLADNPERFARLVPANTGLPDGKGIPDEMGPAMRAMYETIPALDAPAMGKKLRENELGAGFMYWIRYCADYPEIRVSDIVALSAAGKEVTEAQRKAYDAPFPSEAYIQGVRQFPSLVPIYPDGPDIAANKAAWQVLGQFTKPVMTAFSDSDPITAGGDKRFQTEMPGAQGQNHVTIEDAGHFLQEDAGDRFANHVIEFVRANPLP